MIARRDLGTIPPYFSWAATCDAIFARQQFVAGIIAAQNRYSRFVTGGF